MDVKSSKIVFCIFLCLRNRTENLDRYFLRILKFINEDFRSHDFS